MFDNPDTRAKWFFIFALVGVVMGIALEIAAYFIPLWRYDPWWIGVLVVSIAFGLSPATLAYLLRKRGRLVLFLVGSGLAFVVEGLFSVVTRGGGGWIHVPPFPFTNPDRPLLRLILLGLGGGLFVLIAREITAWLHQKSEAAATQSSDITES